VTQIFFLEGTFTVLVGLSAYYWVPGYPRDAAVRGPHGHPGRRWRAAQFLNDRDRAVLVARLAADSDAADHEPFAWKGVGARHCFAAGGRVLIRAVGEAFRDHLVWAYGLLFHGFAFLLCEWCERRAPGDADRR
jgi:hypothetical protein